ncbi:MAG TPA: hypothetical protein VL485_00025 [Ktedonobacteraceae bacterium]|nr:hypothetical protein [Ktedonobacteraceae bacterium]
MQRYIGIFCCQVSQLLLEVSFKDQVRRQPHRLIALSLRIVFLLENIEGETANQIVHLTSNDTTSELPTDELVERWFPTVPLRSSIETREPRWSLIAGSRAAELLGYRPSYRWSKTLNIATVDDQQLLPSSKGVPQ